MNSTGSSEALSSDNPHTLCMEPVFGPRQFALTTLAVTMSAVGYLGLTDSLTLRVALVGVSFAAALILAYDLGYRTNQKITQ